MNKNVMKKMFSTVLFCGISFFAFARGDQELVEAGHWIYDSIENLCMESGIVNFADSEPASISELKLYLQEIDFFKLSEAGRAELKKIQNYFEYEQIGLKSDIINFGIEPSFNLSVFSKTNNDIDWVYDRYERKPFIFVPLNFTVSDFVAMKMDILLGMNKNNAVKNDVYSNVPLSADAIDINFPDTAYFSIGHGLTQKTGVSFQIGKGARNIGKTLAGSMIWSEYLTGASYAQLSIYSPDIKYTGIVSQFNVDRYMYAHQFDIRLFKKLTITALEGVFVNAPVELRYLNPFTIFHGMAPWREYPDEGDDSYDRESHTGAYLGIKFQFAPVSNLKFYGLFAMTQFQTSYETSNYPDDTTPNAMGGQLGGKYTLPVSKGRFTFALEGSYAQPYLYIKESPNWSLVRTYAENMGNKKYPFYEWIGSPFGPDTISGELNMGYEVPEKWALNFIYLFMARGEMSGTRVFDTMVDSDGKYLWGGVHTNDEPITNTDEKDTTNGWCYPGSSNKSSVFPSLTAKDLQSLVTPTGTPEFVNRISVRGTYNFSSKIECVLQPSFVFIFNKGHEEGKKAAGLEVAGACSIKL